MERAEFLKAVRAPKPQHGSLSLSDRLVEIFGAIV
jgi:hypothetical protein